MTHPTSIPSPTPACAAFEPLLPLLATDALTPDEAAATRRHVAGCAWCRAQCMGYGAFEAALIRHYSSDSPMGVSFTLADVLHADEYSDEAAIDDASQLVPDVSSIAPTAPHTSPWRWRPQYGAEIAAVLVVGLLAMTLILAQLGPLNGLPSNQQPVKSPAGALIFTHGVSWGMLQLNGRTVSPSADYTKPIYLAPGKNTLFYHAPPFPDLTCTISAPVAAGDSCSLMRLPSDLGALNGTPNSTFKGRMVDLMATPDRLSSSQRDTLIAATQHALDAFTVTTQVQPGDHYATPEGRFPAANQPFTMTLSYHIAANDIMAGFSICAPFCGMPENYWTMEPSIHWTYVNQYGEPETVRQGAFDGNMTMTLDAQWNGTWNVTVVPEGLIATICSTTDMLLEGLLGHNVIVSLGMTCGPAAASYATPHLDAILLPITYTKSGDIQNISGNVLYHAGAFIVLDSNARYLFPSLPMASAHELAIARQLGYKG